MYPTEVIVHVVQGDGRYVVLNLLRKPIGQSGKSAHRHSHCEVLALYITGIDVLRIGRAHDRYNARSDALRRAVTLLFALVRTVHFDEHRIVDIGPEGILYCVKVWPVPVRG